MGSKEKVWVSLQDDDWLFKRPRPHTGEHWAEKATAELARLINLDAATVELATLEETRGTISRSFVPRIATLTHGNELLSEQHPGYEPSVEGAYPEYRVDRIFEAIADVDASQHSESPNASHEVVGFLIFDGWIANTDRHHENWAILQVPGDENDRMAPTFDHASSLGRLLDDDRRLRILNGADMLSVRGYLDRRDAQGSIFPLKGSDPACPFRLVSDLIELGHADSVKHWLERIEKVTRDKKRAVFEAFPGDWLTEPSMNFALQILDETEELMNEEWQSCDT